jgi:glutamate racemase
VIEQIGDGLVELVENGKTSGIEVETLLHKYIDPIMAAGADKLVLGCTHYPFLIDAIKKVSNNNLEIINPAPAVALQTKKLLADKEKNIKNNLGNSTFISTANIDTLKKLVLTVDANIDEQHFIMQKI